MEKDCCSPDVLSRIRAVEIYLDTHREKLDVLTRALEKNNSRLERVCDKLSEIKTQQKVTHALAAVGGSAIAFVGNMFLKHGGQ